MTRRGTVGVSGTPGRLRPLVMAPCLGMWLARRATPVAGQQRLTIVTVTAMKLLLQETFAALAATLKPPSAPDSGGSTYSSCEMNDESQQRVLSVIDGTGSAESKLATVRQLLAAGVAPASPNSSQMPPAQMTIPPGHVLRASACSSSDGRQGQVMVDVVPAHKAAEHFHERHHRFDRDADQAQPGAHRRGGGRGQRPEGRQDSDQPAPHCNDRGIRVPPGYVLRSSASTDGRGEVLDFQPVADASRHMQERHERGDQPWMEHLQRSSHEWHEPHQPHWYRQRWSGPRM